MAAFNRYKQKNAPKQVFFALLGVLANKKRWNECLDLSGRSAVAILFHWF